MDARAIVSTVPSTSTLAPFVCAAAGPSPLGLLVFYALYLGALLLGLGLWRRQVQSIDSPIPHTQSTTHLLPHTH